MASTNGHPKPEDTPLVVVTGSGSCGSTFFMRLLHELDFDIGVDRLTTTVDEPRGMEYAPVAQLLADLEMEYSPFPLPPRDVKLRGRTPTPPSMQEFVLAASDVDTALTYSDRIQAISRELPEVIKAPAFSRWLGLWLRAGGKRPDAVVVCMRTSVPLAASSFWRDGLGPGDLWEMTAWLYVSQGMLWDTLRSERLPVTTIEFPTSVRDIEHVWNSFPGIRLRGVDKYKEAFHKVADEGLIHLG